MTQEPNEVNHVKQMQKNIDSFIKDIAEVFNKKTKGVSGPELNEYGISTEIESLSRLFSLANNLREYLNEPDIVSEGSQFPSGYPVYFEPTPITPSFIPEVYCSVGNNGEAK